jgi:hypothetical protein
VSDSGQIMSGIGRAGDCSRKGAKKAKAQSVFLAALQPVLAHAGMNKRYSVRNDVTGFANAALIER